VTSDITHKLKHTNIYTHKDLDSHTQTYDLKHRYTHKHTQTHKHKNRLAKSHTQTHKRTHRHM